MNLGAAADLVQLVQPTSRAGVMVVLFPSMTLRTCGSFLHTETIVLLSLSLPTPYPVQALSGERVCPVSKLAAEVDGVDNQNREVDFSKNNGEALLLLLHFAHIHIFSGNNMTFW